MERQMDRKGRRGHATCPETEIFRRLAVDPADSEYLVALYEKYEKELKEAAACYLGRKEISKRAVNNILVALGRQAKTFDPQSTEAVGWVRRCADAEARKLRDALNATRRQHCKTRRAV